MKDIGESSVISLPNATPFFQSVSTTPAELLNNIFNTRYSGGNHTVKCIFHDDKKPSLVVNFDTGAFECKSCSKRGTDITDIYAHHLNINFSQARNRLKIKKILLTPRRGEAPLTLQQMTNMGNTKKNLHGKKNNNIQPLANPSTKMIAEIFPQQLRAGFTFQSLHPYHDDDGLIIYWRVRFVHPDGSKKIMPLSYENEKWKIKEPAFEGLKPLYNLHLLQKAPRDQTVYLVEGEKCADVIVSRRGIGITSGGAISAKGADWSKLKGRTIIVIPDNDPAGHKYAAEVIKALATQTEKVSLLDISQLELTSGQDIADWFEISMDNTIGRLNSMKAIQPIVSQDIQAPNNHKEKSARDKYTLLFGQFYRFNESIYVEDKSNKKYIEVCKFVEITAFTRCSESKDYGAVAIFKGKSKKLITLHFDFKNMHVGTELIERFSDTGLYINPAKSIIFKQYIAAACERQAKCLRRSLKPGWFNGESTNFVLPDKVIGTADDIIFQPKEPSSLSETIKQLGSLQDWKAAIESKLPGNHYLVASLGLSLSSLLLNAAKLENRGFNLCGCSGSGKTTAIQVAATLFGDGTQPGQGVDNIYTQQWNSTANSMEMLTSQHNDLPMIIDELGMLDDKNFGKTIYRMCSGTIKGRLTASSKLKEVGTSRNIILMSAEIPISDKVSENGTPPKAGQLVRFVDIAVTKENMVTELHGVANAKLFIEELKLNCGKYYGTAGPEFIRCLIADDTVDILALRKAAENELAEANLGISSEHQRVFRHFALVVVALRLAHKYSILDNDLSESILVVAKNYIETSGSLNDAHRAVTHLRESLIAKIHQFDIPKTGYKVPGGCERQGLIIGNVPMTSSDDNNKPKSLDGCKVGTVISGPPPDERYFLMTKLSITKILGLYPFQETMEYLKALGLLNTDAGRLTGKKRSFSGEGRARYYEISFDFLEN